MKPFLRPLVGFSIARGLSTYQLQRWDKAHEAVFTLFPHLHHSELTIGASVLCVWSHFDPNISITKTQGGDVLILAGSPLNNCDSRQLESLLCNPPVFANSTRLPLEGRVLVARISTDGKEWQLWNDWVGSIPVFLSKLDTVELISTLEPVALCGTDLSSSHLNRRGLVELLLLGQFIGSDTLYKPMTTLEPDSHLLWKMGEVSQRVYLQSIKSERLDSSIKNSLIAEKLYEITRQVVIQSLNNQSVPISLPLSSGMDSRLIACIAAEAKLPVEAYTYGPLEWAEVQDAHDVAKVLGIPWHHIELDTSYLATFIRPWLTLFGSSLHAHGMYQFPYVMGQMNKGTLIPNGFLGNNMAGGNHPNDCMFDHDKGLLERYCGYGTFWGCESLPSLLDFDPTPYYEEIEALLQAQVLTVAHWSDYQQMNFIDMWNRQARWISYQPVMYGYAGFECSPFMHRDYASFCMSLSSDLLVKRKLQIEMLTRYWPIAGRVKSTFVPLTGWERKWHGIRYMVASKLPKSLRPLLGSTYVNNMALDCVASQGMDCLFPITMNMDAIGPIRRKPLLKAVERCIAGSQKDLLKVIAVQPIVFRLLNKELGN
jgi:hypothetical protein